MEERAVEDAAENVRGQDEIRREDGARCCKAAWPARVLLSDLLCMALHVEALVTRPPATLAQLRSMLTELREDHDEDVIELEEALAEILRKLDQLIALVTARTAPP